MNVLKFKKKKPSPSFLELATLHCQSEEHSARPQTPVFQTHFSIILQVALVFYKLSFFLRFSSKTLYEWRPKNNRNYFFRMID